MIERRVQRRARIFQRIRAAARDHLARKSLRHVYVNAVLAKGEACLHLLYSGAGQSGDPSVAASPQF